MIGARGTVTHEYGDRVSCCKPVKLSLDVQKVEQGVNDIDGKNQYNVGLRPISIE